MSGGWCAGAVRSEVRARSAGAPARVRRALRRVGREPVRRRCPTPGGARVHRVEPEAMPAAGAAGQGERGEVSDECGAKRRREESEASVRHRVGNFGTAWRALRQAERAASASERRRQGLQRKSERSGDCSGKPGREAGRPDCWYGYPYPHPSSTASTPSPSAPWSSVSDAWSPAAPASSESASTRSPPSSAPTPATSSARTAHCRRASRDGEGARAVAGESSSAPGHAEEERRSRRGARRRRRRAKRRRAVRWRRRSGPTKEKRAAPPKRCDPWVAKRLRRRRAAPGCRARRPCRRGCR